MRTTEPPDFGLGDWRSYRCDVCGEQATTLSREPIPLLPRPGGIWQEFAPGPVRVRCDKHPAESGDGGVTPS